jgi:predicted Zn finger-like uncharacterized protein
MRLICPVCSAQYEVDGGMIPAEGRDVQCSACGKVWLATLGRSAGAQPETRPEPRTERVPETHAEAAADGPAEVARSGHEAVAAPGAKAAPVAEAPAAQETRPGAQSASETETRPATGDAPTKEAATEPEAASAGVREEGRTVEPPTETPSAGEPASGKAAGTGSDSPPVLGGAPVSVTAPADAPAEAGEMPPEEPMPPARRTVTPAIADILRAEAKRERAARAAEAQATLERQDEFPLTAPEGAASGARRGPRSDLGKGVTGRAEGGTTEGGDPSDDLAAAIKKIVAEEANRMVTDVSAVRGAASLDVPAAAVRAGEPPALTPAQLSAATRRDRLPDIEEISSTLSPAVALPPEEDDAPEPRRRSGSGFRLGFGIVLLLSTLLAMVYIYAPRIIAEVPQSETYVRAYADAVDDGRLWLDQQLNRVLDAVGTESGPGE